MYSLPQKLAAEFVGSFSLVFFAAGAICCDQYLRTSSQIGIGLLGMALAYGLAMAVLFSALGHISGGHFNPAISIGFWVTRRLGTLHTLLYWAAQIGGAVCACYLLRALLAVSAWGPVSLGAPSLAADFTRAQGMILEGVAAFLVVLIFFATAVDINNSSNKFAGFVIGLAITAGVLATGPFTGGSMNPARAFGPALASHHWANHGVYWIGPLLGGVLAAWFYDRIFLRE
ncbi:MAG: aquaporin [Candidatus Acidiferrales bacterium]